MLRPNDLWWNYNVDKYLKGNKPIPLDLLFWNNDSTNLPGPMYCWYLRHTYLQNALATGTTPSESISCNKRRSPVPPLSGCIKPRPHSPIKTLTQQRPLQNRGLGLPRRS